MKQYPSIPGSKERDAVPLGASCVGFVKYDGSNLRWEWNRKRGFYKHGTRHRLFGADEAPYNQAIELFQDVLAPEIQRAMLAENKGLTEMTAYTEFFGASSFAGSHTLEEPKQLKLIDVWVFKKDFVPPKTFLKLFGAQPWCAHPFYEGALDESVLNSVRHGGFEAVEHFHEGAVFKGVDKRGEVWMVKVKTLAYLKKLQQVFGRDWIRYE